MKSFLIVKEYLLVSPYQAQIFSSSMIKMGDGRIRKVITTTLLGSYKNHLTIYLMMKMRSKSIKSSFSNFKICLMMARIKITIKNRKLDQKSIKLKATKVKVRNCLKSLAKMKVWGIISLQTYLYISKWERNIFRVSCLDLKRQQACSKSENSSNKIHKN